MLTRAAPDEIVPVEIAAGPLAGMHMRLDLRIEKDLWLGTYEPALLDAINYFVSPGQTVYDVGANIGYMSLALAKAVGENGRVVAFEPLPENLARLEANLALNAEGKRVKVVGAAVGERTTQEQFLVHHSGAMGKLHASTGKQAEYERSLTVEVVALDNWAADNNYESPELIKVDVEGGEAAVFRGMSGLLEKSRPTILLELHGLEAAEAVQRILAAAAYGLHEMRQGYPEVSEITSWKSHVVALPRDAKREMRSGEK
jgi:FkbM family methyltransferase